MCTAGPTYYVLPCKSATNVVGGEVGVLRGGMRWETIDDSWVFPI